jgi:serine beta-lactamase-like protein LACTB, mitochondrial
MNMLRLGRFVTLLFLLVGASIRAEEIASLPSPVNVSIESMMKQEMEKQQTVGAAIGIVYKGEIVYLKGYGHGDVKEDMPATTDSMFRWASISKIVTAFAAMQLWEQGKLDLDVDVRTYVPEFPDKGVKITARQLLTHQGGIVHYSNGPVIETKVDNTVEHPFESVIVSLDKFKESPLIGEPGAQFSYTTHGFMLLSAVVERAGGEAFATQTRKRIFEPAGMTTMQPDYPWVDIPDRVTGYFLSRKMPRASRHEDVHWKLGGGGYISTIEDLTLFAKHILDGGFVKPDTMKEMWTAYPTNDGTPTNRGLGFVVQGEGNDLVVQHSGAQNKTRTLMILIPHQEIALTFMTNSEYTDLDGFIGPLIGIIREHVRVNG